MLVWSNFRPSVCLALNAPLVGGMVGGGERAFEDFCNSMTKDMTANESSLNAINRVKFMHFAWVALGILLATIIRFPIQSVIHNTSPFLFYFPVVVVLALAFGLRFGLLNLYVNPRDPESLGLRILDILQESHLRPRSSSAGVQKARSLYSWPAVAQQFLDYCTSNR